MLELGALTLSWLQALLLPLTRVTAFFLAAPVFSQAAATGRIRIVYAGALCVVMMPADRKSTRLNSSHVSESRMPSSA